MALVRTIITDALVELGVLRPGASLTPAMSETGLSRVQGMIDSWAANRQTLSRQLRTSFTMPDGDSEIVIGSGQAVDIPTPMWIDTINYVNPGSDPGVEVPIGKMDQDAFAALSIKELSSALPIQSFYQTNLADAFGTLFLWPQVSQDVTIVIYTPQAIAVPTSLETNLIGPPGYADAFMYGLAVRLMTPFAVAADSVPMLLGSEGFAARAWNNMVRPNAQPGVLSIDPALTIGTGAGYNILSDQMQSSR